MRYNPAQHLIDSVTNFINNEEESGNRLMKFVDNNLLYLGTAIACKLPNGKYIINDTIYGTYSIEDIKGYRLLADKGRRASSDLIEFNRYLMIGFILEEIVGTDKIDRRVSGLPSFVKNLALIER